MRKRNSAEWFGDTISVPSVASGHSEFRPDSHLTLPVTRLLDFQSNSDVLRVVLQSDTAGVVELPQLTRPLVSIHFGRTVHLECRHGNKKHAGLAVHGDIEIIPSGIPVRWEMKEPDTALLISISQSLLERVAGECGVEDDHLELQDRFHIRDPHIERIGWALMGEVEQGYPSGRLYMESMATALAVQLVRNHSSASGQRTMPSGGLSRGKLRLVLSYIEDNLNGELPLVAIAEIAGISVSHLKALFRQSVGIPVHQYVIRRRVERAALLLRRSSIPISQIALETGFAHQSHLAMHMRRVLGLAPSDIAKLPEIA